MVIPFGADTVTAAQVLNAGDGYTYRLPAIAVHPGKALRLNSGDLVFGTPPPLATLPLVADQLQFLGGHFQHHCGIWAKPARLFIARYFDFIEAEIATHNDELKTALKRFGSLYMPEHWAFSALRPLPRALPRIRIRCFWSGKDTCAGRAISPSNQSKQASRLRSSP